MKKLHIKLAHPAPTSFQRMLRKAGARREVIAAAPFLKCITCEELTRPKGNRAAAVKDDEEKIEFNTNVYMDDLEFVLTDGSKVMAKAIIDERTALGMLVPLNSTRVVGAEETC